MKSRKQKMDICNISEYFKLNNKFSIAAYRHTDVPLHRHNFFELAYVTDGKARNVIDGKSYTVERGDYFVMNRFSTHSYHTISSDPLRIINCLFLPEFLDAALVKKNKVSDLLDSYLIRFDYDLMASPEQHIFRDEDGKVLSLLLNMQSEAERMQGGYTEMIRMQLAEIFILTMRKIAGKAKTSSLSAQIVAYIENNFSGDLKFGDLCKTLNYSLPYLSKTIQKETGETFTEWVQKIRLRECCRRLLSGNDKIETIARDCGFIDMNYFRTLFKKRMGITPREYRNAFSANDPDPAE